MSLSVPVLFDRQGAGNVEKTNLTPIVCFDPEYARQRPFRQEKMI
jgi:hypothetical protein